MSHSPFRRALLLAGLASGAAAATVTPSDPLRRPAARAPRALAAMLLDLTLAGERIVAVGERGTVLVSDDGGRRWLQVECPVSSTLTAVTFAGARLGWAVGHGGVVLHSHDAGTTWKRQLDGHQAARIELVAAQAAGQAPRLQRARQWVDDGADKPWLDVHFTADGRRGLVVGAYGMAAATEDGGMTWHSAIDRIDNPKGLHLNALHDTGESLWIAGEQGALFRSADGGRSFVRVRGPYEGSWFALCSLGDDLVVAAGLRGNAWFTTDRGATWQRGEVPMLASLIGALRGGPGEMLLLNQAGVLLSSTDRCHSFRPVPTPPGPPATAVLALVDGGYVAATMAGAARWPRAPAPAPGKAP